MPLRPSIFPENDNRPDPSANAYQSPDFGAGVYIGEYTPPMPKSRNRLIGLDGDTVVLPPPPDGETEWDEQDYRAAAANVKGYTPAGPRRASTASWTDRAGKPQTWSYEPEDTSRGAYKQLSAQQIAEAKAARLKAAARAEADAESKRLTDAELAKAKAMSQMRLDEEGKRTEILTAQERAKRQLAIDMPTTAERAASGQADLLQAQLDAAKAALTRQEADAANPQYADLRALAARARQGDPDAQMRLLRTDQAALKAAGVDLSTLSPLSAAQTLQVALSEAPPGQKARVVFEKMPEFRANVENILGEMQGTGVYKPEDITDWRARLGDLVGALPADVQREVTAAINAQAEAILRTKTPARTGPLGIFAGQQVGGSNRLLGSSGLQFGR